MMDATERREENRDETPSRTRLVRVDVFQSETGLGYIVSPPPWVELIDGREAGAMLRKAAAFVMALAEEMEAKADD